jgi:RNA polymerase sigma factor (sigma-70 family)
MTLERGFGTWVRELNAGEESAAAEVFRRFAARLTLLARAQFRQRMLQKEDPEDVVQSVFSSFFRQQREGQFTFAGWDSVWDVLVVITLHKCHNRREYFLAARRDIHREVTLGTWEGPASEPAAPEPTPEEVATLADLIEGLLRPLDEDHRAILSLYLQDYTVPEIARRAGFSQRTVWRSLRRVRNHARRLLAEDP